MTVEMKKARRRLALAAVIFGISIGGLPVLWGIVESAAPRQVEPSRPLQTSDAPPMVSGSMPATDAPSGPEPDASEELTDLELFGPSDPQPRATPEQEHEIDISALFDSPEKAPPASVDGIEPTTADESPSQASTAWRLLEASMTSLALGLMAALVATGLGVILGTVSGYRRGWTERVILRWFADGVGVLPQFVVAVILIGLYRDGVGVEGHPWDVLVVAALVGVVNSPQVLLQVDNRVRVIAAGKFVVAARLMGLAPWQVLWRKILPLMVDELVVPLTHQIYWAIFMETAISYLGFGIAEPLTSLGCELATLDPIMNQGDLPVAVIICGMTVGTAASLKMGGDAIERILMNRRGSTPTRV